MPTLADLQSRTFNTAGTKRRPIVLNPDSAIGRKWLELKASNAPVGVPLGPEEPLDDGQVAQAFSSGAVLVWRGGDVVDVV
jgi:uncharacterized protein with LGFP repeats